MLSDINEEGNFGDRWLVITTKKVFTVNPKTKQFFKVPLELVQSAEVKDYVGNGELVLETPVGVKRLMRFSRRYVDPFRRVAAFIDVVTKKISHGWKKQGMKATGLSIRMRTPSLR